MKVGGSVWRNDERESFCVELDGACDEVCIAGGDVVGMSDAGNTALFFEGVEGAGNDGEGNAETFGESGRIQRGSLFALEKVEDAIGQLAGSRHGF